MSSRLLRAYLWWWVGGLAVVVCLVTIWESGWQGEQVLELPAASAEVVLAGSQEPAVTAPYFHDGRAPTLEEAVAMMARVQLGGTLTPEETHAIVQFLHTLTGEYQGRSLTNVPEKD
jgi:cytochrome c peroxidase